MATTDIIEAYIAAWNEPDAGKRRKLLDTAWADDGAYCDPLADIAGRDALDGLIAAFHAQRPGASIERVSAVDQHHDKVRFAWAFKDAAGNTQVAGIDVGELAADGRLSRIWGFWGDPPGK